LTDFNNLIEMLELPQEVVEDVIENEQLIIMEEQKDHLNIIRSNVEVYEPFNIEIFTKELHERSSIKNQLYREATQNINAYDLATNCIRDIVYKLLNTPVESFADKWLPILLRSTLGTAIHNFIQDNSDQFTEREISLKIPSKRVSIRLDNLIGSNILVEIKSLPYSEYEKIIRSCRPRIGDFYQTMAYKYFLENFLDEIKSYGSEVIKSGKKINLPLLDKYDIQKVQFIYVAHDVTATDVESFDEIIERIRQLKKLLNSKSNTFFFITTLVVDVTNNIADPYIDYIRKKLDRINYYLDNGKIPGDDDEFVDKKKCFFCLYKKLCDS